MRQERKARYGWTGRNGDHNGPKKVLRELKSCVLGTSVVSAGEVDAVDVRFSECSSLRNKSQEGKDDWTERDGDLNGPKKC